MIFDIPPEGKQTEIPTTPHLRNRPSINPLN